MLVSFSGMIFIWNYMRVGEFGSKFTGITKKETDGHTHTHTHARTYIWVWRYLCSSQGILTIEYMVVLGKDFTLTSIKKTA